MKLHFDRAAVTKLLEHTRAAPKHSLAIIYYTRRKPKPRARK